MSTRRMTSTGVEWRHQCESVVGAQISSHLVEQRFILQQVIQVFEHGIGLHYRFGYPCKDIFRVIAVDEYDPFVLAGIWLPAVMSGWLRLARRWVFLNQYRYACLCS